VTKPNIKNVKKTILLFLTIITFSCSKSANDDGLNDLTLAGTLLTARINGERYASDDENVVAELYDYGFGLQLILSGGTVISNPGFALVEGIGIGISFENMEELTNGAIWDSSESEDIRTVTGSYTYGNATLSSAETVLAGSNIGNGYAIFEITEINIQNTTISGEFSFLAIDEETGREFLVTQGKINNVTYTLN
jgi:hypothetical protein